MNTLGGFVIDGRNNVKTTIVDGRLVWFDKPKPTRSQLLIWAGLILAVMALFALTAAPLEGSAESILQSENLIYLINQDRARYDLPALRSNPKLETAARAKAEDILKNDYFSHISPDGVTPWSFIENAGFNYSFAGENLAMNYTNSYELENDLLKSPSHRANLLSPLFSEIGIATLRGNYNGEPATITVQMFGSPVKYSQ